MSSVSQLGERALIERILRRCGSGLTRHSPSFKVLTDNGDDAFVAKLTSNSPLVFTTDTLVEGTHFNLSYCRRFMSEKQAWQSIGYKAMAVNLSDLAAMGTVEPILALITIAINGDISVDCVDNLYTGMLSLSKKHRFRIVGGDIIRSDKSIVSITLVGKGTETRLLCRSKTVPGEVLMATGPIGESLAGLEILKNRVKINKTSSRPLINAQLRPKPRLNEGKILSSEAIMATSCMDLSDDLAGSLEILARVNQVGFDLEFADIPVSGPLREFCRVTGADPVQYLLYGGEDYQLLFTVRPSKVDRVRQKIPGAFVLGAVRNHAHGIQYRKNRAPLRVRDIRFKHF